MITTAEIISGLDSVTASPADAGRLEFIVVRPAKGVRELRETVRVSPEGGVEGDRWADEPDKRLDPRSQVSLMNARILKLISVEAERISLAGDNLIVDLDLSESNLTPGQRLMVGEAVLEVTDVPHNGCGKFLERYGSDAVKLINSPEGRRLHLRGLYAQVVSAGLVSVGDEVRKIES